MLWDNAWYGGHHVPGYSILFPPLGAVLGVRLAGALCGIASTILFDRLAREQFGDGAWLGVVWFAAATAVNLITGRLAFDLGVTFGIAAVLAMTRGRTVLALVLAVATTLASPVAGLFLGLAALAWLIASRRPLAFWFGAACVGPALALSVVFPEGGTEPFVASSFWPELITCALLLLAAPREMRTLRIGVALYALACIAAYVIPSPMGGNVVRLGTCFAGPLVACVLWPHRRLVLVAFAVPLLWWQWSAPVHDLERAERDPSVHASYYRPLLAFLHARQRASEQPFRIEIPFTANHWEATEVAPSVPLARGWERQLDRLDNPLFYRPTLSAADYRSWLLRRGVRYVALPSARLDPSAIAEAALLRHGQPWLVPVWHDHAWRVWRVRGAPGLATGAGVMTSLETQGFTVRMRRTGTADVDVRFTPYWAIVRGSGCVAPGSDGMTRVHGARGESITVGAQFALGRVLSNSPRCTR